MEENTGQENVSSISLYSLLENAKLCDYYEKFLHQGGDDIDQLCEASELEFKEITKLVGMHTKPLHIRRLQKVLLEYWTEETKSGNKSVSNSLGPSWIETWNAQHSSQTKTGISLTKPTTTSITITSNESPIVNESQPSTSKRGRPPKYPKRIKTGVFELKLPAMEAIIDWENLDDERKQLIREHSRIYGRDTKKRKSTDLNSHEQMINEAAAQLCLRDPTLLVRRDELFTQARRIVRDSGFSFVHGHSRSKFASEDGGVTMVDKGKKNRQDRLQEVNAVVEKLKERQNMLMEKKNEFENTDQLTGDLQQELNNIQSQLNKFLIEQKELQKRQRRSERYYHTKQTRSTLSMCESSQPAQVEAPMEEIPAEHEEQHSVVVTEILHSADDPNPQQDATSSDPNAGDQAVFAFIPQQPDPSGNFHTIRSGTALDQTTINTILALANEDKSNANAQVLQNLLGHIGLPSNQITPQQLIAQLMPTTSPDQGALTQEQQQQYVQQSGINVVEQLATSTSPSELISHVPNNTSHNVVTSLQDTSQIVQDQYVQETFSG